MRITEKTAPKKKPSRSRPAPDRPGPAGVESPQEALELLQRACRRQKNIDAWEIYLEEEERLTIEAREGEVESLISARVMGVAVRAVCRGRLGFSFSNDFSVKSLREAVVKASEAARLMPPSPCPEFVKPPEVPWPDLDIADPGLGRVPEKDKVRRAMEIESSALALDPRVTRVRGAEYDEATSRVWIVNSEGLKARAETTLVSAAAEVMAEHGKDAQSASELETVHYYDKLDVAKVGRQAARQAVDLLGARPMPATRCPVVFAPETAAGLISVLAPAACGDAVTKGRSWLIAKKGRKIASQAVTIVDDGLMTEGAGAFPFDDEGTASRRVVVVREGVLENFLYDTYYGKIARTGSTGNGLRPGYYFPPVVDTTNWALLPGGATQEELVSQVDDGLLVVELLGLHTADAVSGEFSVGAVGFRIKRGGLDGPVTGITIAGTLEEMLGRIEAVAANLKFSGEAGAPAILIGNMDISGPG